MQGIYFFWQLGFMKYFQTRYDVAKITLCGASAGGLIATLTACNVDLDAAVELAWKLRYVALHPCFCWSSAARLGALMACRVFNAFFIVHRIILGAQGALLC